MQTETEIKDRAELLFSCLIYDSEVEQTFKKGERICINQERAVLHSKINQTPDERSYQVPVMIEVKIKKLAQKIKDQNWSPPPTDNDGPLE